MLFAGLAGPGKSVLARRVADATYRGSGCCGSAVSHGRRNCLALLVVDIGAAAGRVAQIAAAAGQLDLVSH